MPTLELTRDEVRALRQLVRWSHGRLSPEIEAAAAKLDEALDDYAQSLAALRAAMKRATP